LFSRNTAQAGQSLLKNATEVLVAAVDPRSLNKKWRWN
jgi:hypothetical protein